MSTYGWNTPWTSGTAGSVTTTKPLSSVLDQHRLVTLQRIAVALERIADTITAR